MYYEFIDYNRNKDQGERVHKHHVIPLSQGGPDTADNMIDLSWSAHYLAHYYLAKDNPDDKKIQADWKKKQNLDQFFRFCYKAARDKHGENNPMFGKHQSEESKELIRQKLIGRKYSDEVNKKKGRPKTEEQRKHLSEMLSGRKDSEETRRKKSIAFKGRYGAANGKHWFNNGEKEMYDYTCPEGFTSGRLKKKGT